MDWEVNCLGVSFLVVLFIYCVILGRIRYVIFLGFIFFVRKMVLIVFFYRVFVRVNEFFRRLCGIVFGM